MRFSLLFVLALAACNDSVCTRNSDCKHGFICGEEDTCVVPPDMTKVDGGDEDGSADLSIASDLASHEDLATFDASIVD